MSGLGGNGKTKNEKRRTKSEECHGKPTATSRDIRGPVRFSFFRFSFSRYHAKACQCPFPTCGDFDDVISRCQRSEGNLCAPPSRGVRVFANRGRAGPVQRLACAPQQARSDIRAE